MKRKHLHVIGFLLAALFLSMPTKAQTQEDTHKRLPLNQQKAPMGNLPPELKGLEFDDFYGANYFPQKVGEPYTPIFYVFYMDNQSNTTINTVEFEYWFDNDRTNVKYKTRDDIQLSPGQSMQDGVGFISFEAPNDTRPHIITIKPYKINGMEVDMGVHVKPFRQYFVEGTYRMPTHYVEVFADPTDKKAYDLYRGLATSIVTLQHKTKKKNRYELVTFVSQAGEATFKASQQENELAKMYKISEMPRMMVNRNLMTPYGTLNNHTQLEDLSTYSPAMKISSKVTDVYEYLLQRGFYGPAFAQMTPSVTKNSDGKFVCNINGRISEQQETKGLRMNVYLVENNFIPETDEDGYVEIPDGTVYNKFVKMISPVEGYELKVNNDRTYTFATDPFAIENFEADKYRLVASIIDPCTEQPYLASVLQSCGVNVSNEQLAEVTMTTAQASGEISFALAAKEANTPITIDWGDGVEVNYTLGTDFSEIKSDIKGADLKIKGNITKLNCMANKLKTLNVANCPKLEVLQAAYNYLSELDLTHSTELQNLEIFGSNTILELDLSHCKSLIRLVASQNFLSDLDVSKCPNLTYVDCSRMKRITELDLSNCHKIKNIIANECAIDKLTIPQDAPLEELSCTNNKLTNLDLTAFNQLKDVNCSGNPIASLKVSSPELLSLYSMETKLTSIDLSKLAKLKFLMLKGNAGITSLNLENNKELEELGFSSCKVNQINLKPLKGLKKLWCGKNLFTMLDLSHNKEITLLDATECKLTTIAFPENNSTLEKALLSKNGFEAIAFENLSALKVINLRTNKLTKVELKGLSSLEELELSYNQLHSVNLKECPSLKQLGVTANGMTACELNTLYNQLPTLPTMPKKYNLYNGTKKDEAVLTSKTSIATEKNWKVYVEGDGSGCTDGIDNADADNTLSIIASKGLLRIHSPFAQSTIRVYTLDGKLLVQQHLTHQDTTISVPFDGACIVRCTDDATNNTTTTKVVL